MPNTSSPLTTRLPIRAAAIFGAAALVGTSLVAGIGPVPVAQAAPTDDYVKSQVFSYTGAMQSWLVPDGVTEVKALVWGAGGGGIFDDASVSLEAAGGGAGAYMEATVPVTEGQTLSLLVGEGGVTGEANYDWAVASKLHGLGGGGVGGAVYQDNLESGPSGGPLAMWGQNGSAGGGLSAVLAGPVASQANVLVAAGGGGGAATWVPAGTSGISFAGGGGVANGHNSSNLVYGGGGGTQTAGGSVASAFCPNPAESGAAMRGGMGGEPDGTQATDPELSKFGGGGGGGGWFGGGGGACLNSKADPETPSSPWPGAGGGGSSYVIATGQLHASLDGGDGVPGTGVVTLPAGGAAQVVPSDYASQVTYVPGSGGGIAAGPQSFGHNGLIILEWEQRPSAGHSSFTVSPGSIPVGDDHTVTVEVNDAGGQPVELTAADVAELKFALTSEQEQVLTVSEFTKVPGTISTYTATVTSTTPGNYPLKVTLFGETVSLLGGGNDAAEFGVGAPNVDCSVGTACSSLWTDPALTYLANGTVKGTVVATIVDQFGNKIENAEVTFAPDAALTADGPLTVNTNADGEATLSFTSTTVGTLPVEATVETTSSPSVAIVEGSPAELEFVPGAVTMTYTVGGDPATADGSESVNITVSVTSESGATPVLTPSLFAGALSLPGGGAVPAGVEVGTFASADGGNTYIAPVTSTVAGVYEVAVTYDGDEIALASSGNKNARFIAGPADATKSTFVVSQTPDVLANGTASQTVTVTLRDKDGNLAEIADPSSLVGSAGSPALVGAFTGSGSTYTAAVTSEMPGAFPVAVDLGGNAVTAEDTAKIDAVFVIGTVTMTYTVEETAATADGSDPVTITVSVTSESGATPVLTPGLFVGALSLPGGGAVPAGVEVGPFTSADGGNTYTAAVTSTVAGVYEVAVDYDGGEVTLASSGNKDATFVAGPADASASTFIVSQTPDVLANGTASQTVTVTLRDKDGNLAEIADPSSLVGSADSPALVGAFTGSGSIYTASVTSGTPGSYPVSVLLDGAPVTAEDSAQIDAVFVIGAVTMTYTVGETAATADGSDPVTITVSVTSESGAVPTVSVDDFDVTVTAVTRGVTPPGVTVGPFSTADGGNTYTAAVTSTVAGSYQVVVDYNTEAIDLAVDGNSTATFVAGPADASASTFIVSQTPDVLADGIAVQTVTVTLRDKFGNLAELGALALTGSADSPALVGAFTGSVSTYTAGVTSGTPGAFAVAVDLDGSAVTAEDTDAIDAIFIPLPSDPPSIDEVTTGGASGTGVPGASIEVTDEGGNPLCTAEVGPDSTWSCVFDPELNPGDKIEAIQKELDKDPSSPVPGQVPLPSDPPSIDEVTTGGASGTGVPGASIEVTDEGGNPLCTAEVGPDSTWSCVFDPELNPGDKIEAVQTEDGKTPSTPAEGEVPLVSDPPSIDEVTTGGASGTGVPGAGIEIKDPETGETLCSTTVGPDSTWSCVFEPELPPGSKIDVIQTENGKTPSTPVPGQVPGPPGTSVPPTVDEAKPGGASGTGVPGASIEIKDPSGKTVCSTTVGGDGKWSCSFKPPLDPGTKITVIQTEKGKQPSEAITVKIAAASKPSGGLSDTGATVLAVGAAAGLLLAGGFLLVARNRRQEEDRVS